MWTIVGLFSAKISPFCFLFVHFFFFFFLAMLYRLNYSCHHYLVVLMAWVHLNHSLSLSLCHHFWRSPLESIQYPHRADESNFCKSANTCESMCTNPCFVSLTSMVYEMRGKRPLFVRCCIRDLFRTACIILVYFPSSFFSKHFIRVQVMQPYSSTDISTAWKNKHFILSEKSNYNMAVNLSMVDHAFPKRVAFCKCCIPTEKCGLVY